MRVFTNRYFPLHNYQNIYSLLKESLTVLKYDNRVYVPLVIKKIDYPIIHLKNQTSSYIPNSLENYRSKFIYIHNDYYDLIDERETKIFKIDNKFLKLDKKITKGDIILLEDTDKHHGVF
jgi:hypothetical protein